MAYPSTYSAWRRSPGTKGSKEQRLTINRTDNEPLPDTLQPKDVVIKIHAVSLNYREIAMLIGTYPRDIESGGIPCSDAAAEVVAIGSAVQRFAVGDRVAPICRIGKLEPDDDGDSESIGVNVPGVLREYALVQEKQVVRLPSNLSWEEGSTLACAALTAWNALDDLKYVPKNASALLQGTGGVSMCALLLCLSAGIRPIITSSSDEKLAAIKKLSPEIAGFNYKTVSDQGEEVKRFTNGRGVDFVVNNTGPGSLMEDIDFLCERGGTVSLVGFLDGFDGNWAPTDIMRLMWKSAKVKGIGIGSKAQFEDMNRYIEENKVRFDVLVNHRPFAFAEAKDAYALLESGKFHGKIVIKVTE
ncbi:hypothetical protein FB567DRAFT_597275 [Paraphoma chrysanthemicola]|uniref:Enoyl reductase (ER) domain-containing protein n=1 Tax=Paraphoma chrysanthemicola TaxID=798071 RepID=A0A8K0VU42_9PLEO|nr:hypothetical protein FB567DRAFT_597275 [Paraphoma chrysanthemicola]